MKTLVTGGGGFIGSHLSEYLLEAGHHVHVIDNFSTGNRDNIRHFETHPRFAWTEGDVMDYDVLEELVADCDEIYHMAAAVGVRLIMEEPVETLVTNVRGTEIVLNLACEYGKKVMLASTSEVYGKTMENNGDIHALKEDEDRTQGATSRRRWAYACSKAFDEFLALAYHDEKDLPVVIVRFFNTVGPRQTGRYGMVIPTFVQRALRDETLYIHGDGKQSRSFTHVKDAVWAVTRLMETDEALGEVYNIGNPGEITIRGLADRVIELTGSRSDIEYIPYEEVYGEGFEDMRRRRPDITKLNDVLGFEPRYDVDEILADVIDHYRAATAADVAKAVAL